MMINKSWITLAALFAIGLIILWPHHNFQEALAQGDHGRDLYAFDAVYKGLLPYKDFWWVYGPIAPYYYGIFFKALGVNIQSILIGQIILQLLTGIIFFLLGRMFLTPAAAFLATCWSWVFWRDFIFTYNHTLGIFLIILSLYFLCNYLQSKTKSDAIWVFILVFLLGLVKINFGLVNLFLCTIILHRKKFPALLAAGIALVGWIAVYGLLLKDLSLSEIRECMPYWGEYQPHNIFLIEAVRLFFENICDELAKDKANLIITILSILSAIYIAVAQKFKHKNFLGLLIVLLTFYAINTHEFIKSGVWYRVAWSQLIAFIIAFFLIDHAVKPKKQVLYWATWGIVSLTLIASIGAHFKKINAYKTPEHFISLPRGQVYTSQLTSHWIGSVEQITHYLKDTLKPDEVFFALPYDPLYYYLTKQQSPSRQLIFFEHTYIPPAQEMSIIKELEAKHVSHVLLSNFFKTDDHYRGTLGVSYCPLIASYIHEKFNPIAQLGEWDSTPGWADHHGVIILKRK